MNYLIGIIIALLGAFFYQRNKTQVAEALNNNVDIKKELNTIDQSEAKNTGELESEEQKQQDLKKQVEEVKTVADGIVEIADFLNNRNKK